MSFSRQSAEVLALQVLGWLVANDDLRPVFQGASGASDDAIKTGATDPVFLGSVLDFILMDDAWVVACCDSLGKPYDCLYTARQFLPGGEQVNWT